MKRTNAKATAGNAFRPSIWNRQGNRPTFDSFPALLPYTQNFIGLK